MLKLRALLLRNYIYYIVLAVAIVYFLFTNFFVKAETKYRDLSIANWTITNIIKKDYGIKFELKNKEKVIAYYYLKEEKVSNFMQTYSIGDKITFKYENIVLKNNTIPNTFNYKKHLYNNNIYNTIEIKEIKLVHKNKNIFYSIKHFLLKRTFKLTKSYNYINSLLFGNNNYIDNDVSTSYQKNGISHLFAISGTHISIFVLLLTQLLKKIKVKENKRYVIIITFLCFYMFLTNFSMSILRSCIFTLFCIVNKLFYFYIKPINLLLLTLSVIIFINPLSVFNIGLQYSFVISFFLIYMKDYIEVKKGYVKKAFLISSISFIVSIPITIANFYELNILSIIYNLVFIPYVETIILPMVLISYALPIFDSILYYLLVALEKSSLLLSKIDIFRVAFCKPSLLIIVLYWVLIAVALCNMKKGRKNGFAFLLILLILNHIWPLKQKDYLTYIDVNQGDSALLSVNNTITLIDTGGQIVTNGDKYTYSLSKNGIIPYLKSKGIKKIDNLIITHGDADHIKESNYIIKNFKVKKVYLNNNEVNYLEEELIKEAKSKNIPVIYLDKNNIINLNGTKLLSVNEKRNNENDSSIVLYTNINNYKLLFLGDISKKIELDIQNNYKFTNIDILKIAHHGSKTSTSEYFLKSINPKYAIISVGLNNMFNHPSNETIKVLNNLNIKYYETKTVGSITFYFDKGTFLFTPP